MAARWLVPVVAVAALMAAPNRLPAKEGDWKFEFSPDPVEPTSGKLDIDLRPNTGQTFHLFVHNLSGERRDLLVKILTADKHTVIAEGKLVKVVRDADGKTAVRVPLTKPAPAVPPAPAAPMAPAPMPAPPMPMPMAPAVPPGTEVKLPAKTGMGVPNFSIVIQAFDERDADKPIQPDITAVIGIREPSSYIVPKKVEYSKNKSANLLTVKMQSTNRLIGPDPCPVELQFPPQDLIRVDALREGVYRRLVTGKEDNREFELYSRDIPLATRVTDDGKFYINIDGVPRAYVYSHSFTTDTEKSADVNELKKDTIRFMEADKTQAPRKLATRPRILPLRVEVDTTNPEIRYEVRVRKLPGDEVVQTISHDTTRERHVYLDPGPMDGGLLVTTRMGDWVLPLDLRDLRGKYTLQAELLNSKNERLDQSLCSLIVDDTKPETLSIEVLPGRDPKENPPRHVRTRPLPVRVTADDPESGVARVLVFFGKVGPDGKIPEGFVDARLVAGAWLADVPLPPPAPPPPPPMPGAPPVIVIPPPKITDLTVVVVNGVGIPSEPVSMRVQLIDPPLGGIIKGTVALSKYGKNLTGVEVRMVDLADGKEKAAGKTDEKTGLFVFEDVLPGAYRLIAQRPDSGPGTRGTEDVRVRAGQTVESRIILTRRPPGP